MALSMTREVDHELAGIATRLRQSTVAVVDVAGRRGRPTAVGAGIIWAAEGLVVTNAHVAQRDRLTVEHADGWRAAARVVARDGDHDLAALRVEGQSALTPVTVGEASTLRPGELVIALGHPLGVPHALSLGVVQRSTQAVRSQQGDTATSELVRADVRLAPGNSGGPLADSRGRVVGVNTLVASGLGVAVAVERVRRFVAELAPGPRLGVVVRPVQVRRRGATVAASTVGLLVLEVARGSAADRGGVLPGDVLFEAAARPLLEPADLTDALRRAAASGTLTLDVGRGGRLTSRTIALSDVGERQHAA